VGDMSPTQTSWPDRTSAKGLEVTPNPARQASDRLATWQPPALGIWATPSPFMQRPRSRQLHTRDLGDTFRGIDPAHLGQVRRLPTTGAPATTPGDRAGTKDRSAYLGRRFRPSEEYRDVTSEEWVQFEDHFAKRKIAIGDCMPVYGTNCVHEYACEQCKLLRAHRISRSAINEPIPNYGVQRSGPELGPNGRTQPQVARLSLPCRVCGVTFILIGHDLHSG
jgi:hypothetical protein